MDIEIPLKIEWKNIAVSLSGGADSALLAYLLCHQIEQAQAFHITVHVISHVRCWKTKPWQEYDSLKIYTWLEKCFQQIHFKRHINFIAPELEWADKGPTIIDEYGKLVSGDNVQQRSYAEYICHKNNIDAYYNGVTRNPRNVDFKGMPTRDIEPTEVNQHLKEMSHMGRMAYHPFRFISKDQIVKEYIRLDIMDLFYMTRSCEGIVPGLDYSNYVPYQYVPVCDECFWCKERSWAIKANEQVQEI